MHIARLGLRPLLVLIGAMAAVLVVLFNFGSSSTQQNANAAGIFNPAGIVCINIEFTTFPHAVQLLARFDHQKYYPNDLGWDITQAAVIGGSGVTPDHNVGDCTATNAGGSPNTLATYAPTQHPTVDPSKRPGNKGLVTLNPYQISWSSCAYEAGLGGWLNSVFTFPLTAGQKDFGAITNGSQDTWLSPNTCTNVGTPTYSTAAHATQRAVENKTTGVVTATAFPGNGLDWDADTCTDWLELSPDKNTRMGNDPFVGGDCAAPVAGNLTGMVDIQVSLLVAQNKMNDQYHCIAREDHDSATNIVGTTAICYDNTGSLSASNSLPAHDAPGEGASNGGTTPQCVYPLGATTVDPVCIGPPPPPPYTTAPPAVGNGTYGVIPGTNGNPSTATDATSLTDSAAFWIPNEYVGAVVTSGGKTMTITSNTSTKLNGANWSGGGNPALGPYTVADNTSVADVLVTTTCFSNIAGGSGPNLIAVLHDGDAADTNLNFGVGSAGPKADLAALKKSVAAVQIFGNQTNGECTAKRPVQHTPGAPGILPTNVYQASPTGNALCSPTCILSPWRQAAFVAHGASAYTDYNNDGCTDFNELAQPNPKGTKCGEDPWNPNLAVGAAPDVTGNWSILVNAKLADCTDAGVGVPCTIVPGYYFECIADIQATGKAIDAKASCYVDSPSFAVNKTKAGSATCPPAAAKFCGDGLPGAPAPGCTVGVACTQLPPNCPAPAPASPCDISQWQLQRVDKSAHLTGTLNNTTNAIELDGCFEDPAGQQPLGAVYVQRASIDAHTGQGYVTIWPFQTNAACMTAATNHNTVGLTPLANIAPATFKAQSARQAKGAAASTRDTDGDGCPDQRELRGTALHPDDNAFGGKRDPANPFDYPDMPAKNGQIRINDVSYVIARYRHDQGMVASPVYDAVADHSALGPGTWNLGPGDSQIRINDVTAVINSYRQDCA